MEGLHALGLRYASGASRVRGVLARRGVSPVAAGVLCAAGAATALALLPAPLAALPVLVLLAVRLLCAGPGGPAPPGGAGPRGGAYGLPAGGAADLLLLAGFVTRAPLWLVTLAALCATVASWAALAGAATGAVRTARRPSGTAALSAAAVLAAATGLAGPALWAVAAGALALAAVRVARLGREPGTARAERPGAAGVRHAREREDRAVRRDRARGPVPRPHPEHPAAPPDDERIEHARVPDGAGHRTRTGATPGFPHGNRPRPR
ncbi:phosphatidate cytidylyltransferase [Streptomyces minutiscleroticus]|uniref:phosphatidate cytidylyltransferase n=1 Tax=Streptomyces minutiscleroticus TaxID=68238 RepID=UPI00332786A3